MHNQQHKRYTPQEVLFISRLLIKQVSLDPVTLQTPGICRLTGARQHVMQIIENILNHRQFVQPHYCAHDYIGALKHTLMNSDLLSVQDPWVQVLKKQVLAEDATKGLVGLREFIKKLAHSKDRNNFITAEIIYQYLHFLTTVFRFQAKNKMNAEHLGIIAGPFFTHLIDDDPIHTLQTTLKLNQLCEVMIAKGYYKATFDNVYNDLVEKWQESDLTELEHERELLKRLRERYSGRVAHFQAEITKIHKQ
jgi:hypothetical protein